MIHENLVSKKLIMVKFPPWRDNQDDVSSVRPASFALTKCSLLKSQLGEWVLGGGGEGK